MFAPVLSLARAKNRALPDQAAWLRGWAAVKQKMASDGRYVAKLCDELPAVLARYNASTLPQIFGDPTLRALVIEGMK
jgi:hypothetical protein